ncbi:hypothetical protein EDC04DRAFT_744325 [Pisolithus marmoratus]|nr:hypothetical protein EDC04DRAFT_744325 [Pisolithus marmoratus]
MRPLTRGHISIRYKTFHCVILCLATRHGLGDVPSLDTVVPCRCTHFFCPLPSLRSHQRRVSGQGDVAVRRGDVS